MLGKFIIKKVAVSVIKGVMEKRAIKKAIEYAEEPNDADKRIDQLEVDVAQLKRFSHPETDWVCLTCGCKAKRVESATKRKRRRRR